MDFIMIDGSYYVFFRYHALIAWWRLAKPDERDQEPSESEEFMNKFRTTFVSKLHEIPKKLGITNVVATMVAKDCPRSDIWRNTHTSDYKAGRKNADVSRFFAESYDRLFAEAGVQTVLAHPRLEADDCIAITTRHILSTYPDARVWIIASDMDYLQLAAPRVTIKTLKYTSLVESKTSFKDPDKDLFCKVVSGDKSDNIPPVFPRCGLRTASRYYDDRDAFESKLASVPGARDRYENNRRLISFDMIPEDLVDGFRRECLGL